MLCHETPMTKEQARQYNIVSLAYLGDAVYELLVRNHLMRLGNFPHGKLHRMALHYVSADGQSGGIDRILPMLTEEETAVYKRGRNSDAMGGKNASVISYKRATGLEALFGYLYLIGDFSRLELLFEVILNEEKGDKEDPS